MASVAPSQSQDPIPPAAAAAPAPGTPGAPAAQRASLPPPPSPPPAQPPSSDPTTLVEAPSIYSQFAQLQLSVEALLAARTHSDIPLPPSVYLHPFDATTSHHLGSASACGSSTSTATSSSDTKLGVSVPALTRQMVQETVWSVSQSLAAHSTSLVPLLAQQPFGSSADSGPRDRLKLLLQEAGADSATASTMARPLVLSNDQVRPQNTNVQRDPLELDDLFSRSDVGSAPAYDDPVRKEDGVANVFSSRHLFEFKSLTRALHPVADTPHADLSDAVAARLATATLLARLSDRIAAQATHTGLEHLEEKMTLPPITEETMGQAQLSQTLTLAGGMLLVELEFYVAPPTASGDGAWKPVVRSRIAFAPDPTAPPSPPSAEASYDAATGQLQSQVMRESEHSGTLDLALLFQADLQFVALSLWKLSLATHSTSDRVKVESQRRIGRFGSNLALLAQLDRASASVSNDCFALLQERTHQARTALTGLDLGLAASTVNFPQPYLTLVPSSEPWDQVLDKLDRDDPDLPRIQLGLRLGPGSSVGTGLQLTPALPASTSGIHALQQAVLGVAPGPVPPLPLSSSNTHLIDLLGSSKGKPALDLVWDNTSAGPSPPIGAGPQGAVLVNWIPLPNNSDFSAAIVRVLEVLHTQRKLNNLLRQALQPTNDPTSTTDPNSTVTIVPSETTVSVTDMDALDAELDALLAPGPERPSSPTRVRTAIELLPTPHVGVALRVPVFAPSAWTRTTLAYTVRAQLVPCGQGAGWNVCVTLAPSTTPANPADPSSLMQAGSEVRQPQAEVLSTLEGYLRYPHIDLAMFVRELVGWAMNALRSDPAWAEGA